MDAVMLDAIKRSFTDYARQRFAPRTPEERCEHAALATWATREGGWRALAAVLAVATLVAAIVHAILRWKISLGGTIVAFDVVAAGLVFGIFASWAGFRRMHHRWISTMVEGFVSAGVSFVAVLALIAWAEGKPLLEAFGPDLLRPVVAGLIVFLTVYLALLVLIATLRYRESEAVARRVDAERNRAELARRLAESELRLLRAQVEPHFLFNTLGSAQQLAERGAPDAARLIADLIRFLRAATPLRADSSTLGEEARLVDAYLSIMARRLGSRLRYRIDVADDVRDAAIAPGMLITLAENAVKHGIEPASEGGEIVLHARRAGESLDISLVDTGVGLAHAPTGQGLGLANIRERLALLHGDKATLELAENAPRGFVAHLRVPLEQAAG
jgi:LytS/YehU family sensor histidine kinase